MSNAIRGLCRVDEQSAPAMRRLFEEVFGHPLSQAEWDWKYGHHRGHGLALEYHGELLAHFGGVTRQVVCGPQQLSACQVCDVAVSPRARNSLSRRGPLYALTTAFLADQIGWGRPHLLGFGFPTERAFAVAQRLGLYEEVDQMCSVSWPSKEVRTWAGLKVQPLKPQDLELRVAELESLWARMRSDLEGCILGVRTPAWLKYRYVEHPRHTYELHGVLRPWTREWLGVVVWRRHPQHLEWVDAVAPQSVWPQLLRASQSAAARMGLPEVQVWTTRSQVQRFMSLQTEFATMKSLAIQVPANAYSPGPSPASLRDRWFLMAGDTDFR